MTDPSDDFLQPLMISGLEAIRRKLDERPLSHHIFDEIAVFAQSFHKACSALEPVINLPTPKVPIAPSPASEGYGATMAREIVTSIKSLATPSTQNPRASRRDLIAAIALAKSEGLDDEVAFLREELYGDENDLSPVERLSKANELIARGRALLDSIQEHQIVDVDAPSSAHAD